MNRDNPSVIIMCLVIAMLVGMIIGAGLGRNEERNMAKKANAGYWSINEDGDSSFLYRVFEKKELNNK